MTARGALALATAAVLALEVGCGTGAVVVEPPDAPKAPEPTKTSSAASSVSSASTPKQANGGAENPGAASASAPSSATTAATSETPRETPKEVGARHVLVQYVGAERAPASVVRTREQAEALAEKVLAKARRGESFTRLATEYSDETGAAERGGALGKFGRGRMARAFEEAAFHLKVGELSDVVETPFGFHVILRTE
jgi:NIMA-interacting peptidyl-prolyl cis-trans isomerase 1